MISNDAGVEADGSYMHFSIGTEYRALTTFMQKRLVAKIGLVALDIAPQTRIRTLIL
ncbi:MAG TPA: hypothetical protein VGD65_02060 [Chryseosolibacter sp.]